MTDIRTEDVHQGKYSVIEDRQVKDLPNLVGEPQNSQQQNRQDKKEVFQDRPGFAEKKMVKPFKNRQDCGLRHGVKVLKIVMPATRKVYRYAAQMINKVANYRIQMPIQETVSVQACRFLNRQN